MFGFRRSKAQRSDDAAATATLPAHRRLIRRRRRPTSAARVRPGLDFSLNGLIYSAMMMFLGLAAINSQANPLFGVFGMMVGVLLASGVLSRLVLRGVVVERRLPAAAQVGRPVRIRYLVGNRKRFWPTFSLTVAELDAGGEGGIFDRQPHAYVLHAASGNAADVAADVVPLRRGWVELDRVQLSTSFPFGFIKRAVIRRHADRLLVGPARAALDPIALTRFLAAESTGLSQRLRRGGNDELIGVREYRPGDPPRTIHWRRSARTAAVTIAGGRAVATRREGGGSGLVVREMRRSSPPRLTVMVDTYAPPGAGVEALGRVEKNLAVAASLVAGANDRGLSVGLVLRGAGGWSESKPDLGKRHRGDLLRLLAEAPRNDAFDVEALVEAGKPLVKGDTTGVIVTADPRRAEQPTLTRGAGNLAYIATDSPGLARYVTFPDALDWSAMATPPET